jgi:plastocyanin
MEPKGGVMQTQKTLRRATLGIAAFAALAITSSAPAHSVTTITISHQMRGCHVWQVGNGKPLPTLSLTVHPGPVVKFVNNDVMPHRLVQTAGHKMRLMHANMNHMSASTSVTFFKKGLYRLTTRAGEDYPGMKMGETKGDDYVLHMTVHVK